MRIALLISLVGNLYSESPSESERTDDVDGVASERQQTSYQTSNLSADNVGPDPQVKLSVGVLTVAPGSKVLALHPGSNRASETGDPLCPRNLE
jgi:hypothetical protein